MFRRCLSFLPIVAVILFASVAATAAIAQERSLPQGLEDWRELILDGYEDLGCAVISEESRVCLWPTSLSIDEQGRYV